MVSSFDLYLAIFLVQDFSLLCFSDEKKKNPLSWLLDTLLKSKPLELLFGPLYQSLS